jgi:hypothetical protein
MQCTGREKSVSQLDCCHPAGSMQPCHRQFRSSQAPPKHIFSNILAKAKRLMKSDCASARSSAILATLKEGISKLSGPRWFQKLVERKSHRGDISAVKLKRTDTTLDPVRLLAIDQHTLLVVGKKEDLLSQKAKELERKGNKIQRRRRKEYIPADGGKARHPASLLARAVTAAATYLGGRCWKVSSLRAELEAAGTQAAAGFTGTSRQARGKPLLYFTSWESQRHYHVPCCE